MTFRTVLFDKDGTLLDFDATFADATARMIDDVVNELGGTADDVAASIGFERATLAFDAGSIVLAGSLDAIAEAMASRLERPDPDLAVRIDRSYRRHTAGRAALIDGVAGTLDVLTRMGLRLGVVTNDTQETAAAHLAEVGLTGRFGVVIGCDSGHGAKPGGGGVAAAAQALQTAPRHCLMVGDSWRDCQAARAAGAVAVAVLSGHAGGDELAPLADHVIDSVAALPDLLRDLAAR